VLVVEQIFFDSTRVAIAIILHAH